MPQLRRSRSVCYQCRVKMTATISILTLGCKVNQCDGQELAQALQARGYCLADGRPADLYIINTCTVTQMADAKARKLIRRTIRQNPGCPVIVTGCYAQVSGSQLGSISGVAAVVSNSDKDRIAEIASSLLPPDSSPARQPVAVPPRGQRVRAFLKVQDGCEHGCTYCIVPRARGPQRSNPLEQVVDELRRLAAAGAQEVVLAGIRLGAYGRDLPRGSLADLLACSRQIPLPRLRLSSLEPMDVTPELIRALASHPSLCPHLHLPLQSGDDAILAAMGRGYTAAQFRQLPAQLRQVWPDVALTTDVMVGFPGETEQAFANTCRLVEEAGFAQLHIFCFSPRPGTTAAQLPGQVPEPVKQERSRRLFALARRLFSREAAKWVGREVRVLFERRDAEGRWQGRTEQYFPVRIKSEADLRGQIRTLRVDGLGTDSLTGAVS